MTLQAVGFPHPPPKIFRFSQPHAEKFSVPGLTFRKTSVISDLDNHALIRSTAVRAWGGAMTDDTEGPETAADHVPMDNLPVPVPAEISPSQRPKTPSPEYPERGYGGINWKKDQEAAKLAAMGLTMDQIAEKMDLRDTRTGELSPGKAANMVRRALGAHYRFTTDEMRLQQLASVSEQKRQLWESLENNDNVLVQQGKVIVLDGTPLADRRLVL